MFPGEARLAATGTPQLVKGDDCAGHTAQSGRAEEGDPKTRMTHLTERTGERVTTGMTDTTRTLRPRFV